MLRNFLLHVTNQMMNSIGKTSEKMHGQKLLNPLEQKMVGCVYDKAVRGTSSRGVSRTYLGVLCDNSQQGRLENFHQHGQNFVIVASLWEKAPLTVLYFNTIFDIFKSFFPEMAIKCHVNIIDLCLFTPLLT